MHRVGVVTDSTGALPPGLAELEGVVVVPLHVVTGRRTGAEGEQVQPADVAEALLERRGEVTTSRPTPAALAAAYRRTGCAEVVSVHLSAALSGTCDAARTAAREVAADGLTVRVVDSGSVAMGLGFGVLAAARAAAAGRSLDAVEQQARTVSGATTCLFCVDTLEHLRRGGRIGPAAALVGTALAVKPLFQVVGGRLTPKEKVRTTSRAVARLVELAGEAAGENPVELAVHHLAAPARAAVLAEQLLTRLPRATALHVSEVGAVVGAHVGPGALGVVVSPGR